MRTIPAEIKTDCPELNEAWKAFVPVIIGESNILIPDTQNDLNWHAFLGHSIDMQGFRAAEFAGVDELSKPTNDFKPLNQRGIGTVELGNLWEVKAIQNHLLYRTQGTGIKTTYDILSAEAGEIGQSLAEAFRDFPYRKGHKYVRALLQNSAKLKEHGYSFRKWLEHQCQELGVVGFPPADFRQRVRQTGKSVEDALCTILQDTFFMVGPEMAPYMLCDWQLWLWKKEKTEVFDTFKLDAFHADFVKLINAKHGHVIPTDKRGFTEWWHGYYPSLPPRLANECIWLYIDDGLLNKTNEGMKKMRKHRKEQLAKFDDDDSNYLQWLIQNPRGFVVNCHNKPSPKYLILHNAKCKTIRMLTKKSGNWISNWTKPYIKVCSPDKKAIEKWAKNEVGGQLRHCRICHP